MPADEKKAPEAAKPEAPKSKSKEEPKAAPLYECLGNILCDFKQHGPGDLIELSDKDAESLMAIGLIKTAG